MKYCAWLAALAGALLLIGLVIHEGAGSVALALASAGWGLLWLLPAHAAALLLDVVAWQILLRRVDRARRASLAFLYWVATVREGVNRLLPTANIGGDLVGIRLARLRIEDGASVAASVIFEMLLTLVNQYLFIALGVVIFVATVKHSTPLWLVLTGLVAALLPVLALAVLLRHGELFWRIEQMAVRLLGRDHRFLAGLDGARLDEAIRELYRHPGTTLRALLWQLSGMLLGSLETWIALMLFNHPVSIATAVALEAMTQATRVLLFMVPLGLGVQEAGIVVFAGLTGITGATGLSVALARRLREILFGVPALLSWQWYEARLLRAAYRAARTGVAATSASAVRG